MKATEGQQSINGSRASQRPASPRSLPLLLPCYATGITTREHLARALLEAFAFSTPQDGPSLAAGSPLLPPTLAPPTGFTTREHLARALLEAICFQTREVLDAMRKDAKLAGLKVLRVDGGASKNDLLMQIQVGGQRLAR